MESKDANGSVVIVELKKLDDFVKTLSANCRDYSVRVGIFGNKAQRKKGEVTNPELGAIHEFGLGVPKRSFLRMPLEMKSVEILNQVKSSENFRNLEHGKPLPVLKDLGHACEAIIEQAFDTGGFGTWPGNKPSTIQRKVARLSKRLQLAAQKKGGDSPLVDTGQLRRSVTSRVEKNSA